MSKMVSMENDKIIGTVYETTDYSRFDVLEGNRTILDQRKAKIKRSIKENGLIFNPIVVNEKFEIIDGQGRFEVCKELGLPVRYVIGVGLRLKECVALNSATTNWNTEDYIESGCVQGKESYIRLKTLVQAHRSIPIVAIINIAGATYGGYGARTNMQRIKDGTFELAQKTADETDETLCFVEKMMVDFQNNGPKPYFMQAVAFVYSLPGVDCEKLLRKWQNNAARQVNVRRFGKISEALSILTAIYNFKSKPEDVIYFDNEYDKYCRKVNAGYAARWGKQQ